jgi:hypothetical protein
LIFLEKTNFSSRSRFVILSIHLIISTYLSIASSIFQQHSTMKTTSLQQSQMTTRREKRARIMNLTEKRNMKSKIFNYIMSILEKSNKNKRNSKSYKFRKIVKLSIKRRIRSRILSEEDQIVVHKWFNVSNIIIESITKTSKQKTKTRRLFYTWRDCFVTKMMNIKIINFIKHFIKLKSKFKSMKKKIFKYTSKERKFANQIFSQMKKADIIIRMNSDWSVWINFSSKKKDSNQLKIIHNYIFLNDCIIKMQYSMHKIKEIINILMKSKFKAFFFIDATWDYWIVIIKKKNVYKTRFVLSHKQWAYLRMRMNLIESSHTYTQFTNLIFDLLSAIENFSAQDTIIKDHEKTIMTSFVNNHLNVEINFEILFNFLHERYFSKATFEFIYLNSKKIIEFIEKLNMIDFTRK